MKIIYISSTSSGMHEHSIYFDLLQEFVKKGHDVTVVYAREKRENKSTELYHENNMRYLGIKTGNVTKNRNLISKAFATLTIDYLFVRSIKKHLDQETYDMVLYSTPPITFSKTIKHFTDKSTLSYLMLKDIFPQNAVDIDMFRKNGLIYKFFRRKENKLYAISDVIGVMSPANQAYLVNDNPSIKHKVELLPNALLPCDGIEQASRSEFGLQEDDTLYLYGGNLGKPQGIDFVLDCMLQFETLENARFIICGSGTESKKIEAFVAENNLKNTVYFGMLEKKRYQQLTLLSDVGLIFLDHRFTIPNYPQRILSYMEAEKPVICATDPNTDIGKIALQNGYGLSIESNNASAWLNCVRTLKRDPELRKTMGANGLAYLNNHYNVSDVSNIVLKHLEGGK